MSILKRQLVLKKQTLKVGENIEVNTVFSILSVIPKTVLINGEAQEIYEIIYVEAQ